MDARAILIARFGIFGNVRLIVGVLVCFGTGTLMGIGGAELIMMFIRLQAMPKGFAVAHIQQQYPYSFITLQLFGFLVPAGASLVIILLCPICFCDDHCMKCCMGRCCHECGKLCRAAACDSDDSNVSDQQSTRSVHVVVNVNQV